MRLKSIFVLIILLGAVGYGQQRWEAGLLLGWYQPELTGLDTSLEAGASDGDLLRKNVLLGYSFAVPVFPSLRVGYARGGSYYSGTDDTTKFSRKFIYRMFVVETYFRPLRRLELNFALAPMWNRGVINLDTQNTETVWHARIGSYSLDVKRPEKMTVNYFGFASLVGLRYYLLSWLALDVRTGFMSTRYRAENWKLNGKKITGPALNLDDEALFTARLVFTW